LVALGPLHLRHKLGLGIHRRGIGDESGAGLGVGVVEIKGRDARATLDQNFVAGLGQATNGLWHERDATLSGESLSWDAELHGRVGPSFVDVVKLERSGQPRNAPTPMPRKSPNDASRRHE